MRIIYLSDANQILQYWKDTIPTHEEDYLYVKDLSHEGPKIFDQLKSKATKIYVGKLGNHAKTNWFNYTITGDMTPTIHEFKWSDTVVRSYNVLLGDYDYKPNDIVDALAYIYINYPGAYGVMPRTPASIIEKALNVSSYMYTSDTKVIDFSHEAFQPGATHIMPQFLNITIPYETHLDIHQAYAAIMSKNIFPINDHVYIDATTCSEEEFNNLFTYPSIVHIVGGKVRLKPNGFPLFHKSIKNKAVSVDKWGNTTMMLSKYDYIYDLKQLYDGLYLTTPAYQVLLENYDIIEPLDILEGIYWKTATNGIGTGFIAKLYNLRTTTTNPALKNFAKLCNEYCAGMFQRKYMQKRVAPWIDLSGNKKDINETPPTPLNCTIGDFITDYLRLEISHLLQKFPIDWIIGYDTDGIFINKSVDEIKPLVQDVLGDAPGTCHFDGIYRNVVHKANKQYYGFDALTGEVFGKIAGVVNGKEVAMQLLKGETTIMSQTYM